MSRNKSSLITEEPRIAHQMLFQIAIHRALVAQKRKGPLRFLAQLHLRLLRSGRRGLSVSSYQNLHELRSRPHFRIHAPRCYDVRLRSPVQRKYFQNPDKIFIRQISPIPSQHAADIALRKPRLPGQIGLRQPAPLRFPLNRYSEVTHTLKKFAQPIAKYATPQFLQEAIPPRSTVRNFVQLCPLETQSNAMSRTKINNPAMTGSLA